MDDTQGMYSGIVTPLNNFLQNLLHQRKFLEDIVTPLKTFSGHCHTPKKISIWDIGSAAVMYT